MDFAWVVDALRRGLKVTRKDWLLASPPMYLYMVTEKSDGKHIIKMRAGNCPDFEWAPTAEQMLTVDDWEEYVETKKEPVFGDTPILQFIRETTGSSGLPCGEAVEDLKAHSGEKRMSAPYFDSICKGCFNCLWRKKGQTNCGGHPNLIKNAAGIVTECSSWVRRPDMTEEAHDKQARKDWTDCAGGIVCTGEDTGYMAEQLELLADIYAEKISQRVAQLLQKMDIPLHKKDTNHA